MEMKQESQIWFSFVLRAVFVEMLCKVAPRQSLKCVVYDMIIANA